MKTIIVKKIKKISLISIFALSILLNHFMLKAQWKQQYLFEDNYSFNSLCFLNQSIGFVAGYYDQPGIFKTYNGGQSWMQVYSGHSDLDIQTIFFANTSVGFASGNLSGDINGVLLMTTNGGASWTYKNLNDTLLLSGVFINSNVGYIVGGCFDEYYNCNALIWKTTDRGSTWEKKIIKTDAIFNCICFPNDTIGYIAGSDESGIVYKTTDGGQTWTSITNDINESVISISFSSKDTGYCTTRNYNNYIGRIYKTTDGGEHWAIVLILNNSEFQGIDFVDNNTGYVVGMDISNMVGYIGKTTDGGVTWKQQKSGITTGLKAVWFSNSKLGFACGYNAILRTDNGGDSVFTKPWGKIGTKWSYWIPQSGGEYSYLPSVIESEKDTMMGENTYYKLKNIEKSSFTDSPYVYIYTNEDIVYFRDNIFEVNNILYNFTLQKNDEYAIYPMHGNFSDYMLVHIDSVTTEKFGDSTFRVQYVTTTSNSFVSAYTWQFGESNKAKIVEFMGATSYFFPQAVGSEYDLISDFCSYEDPSGFIYKQHQEDSCGVPKKSSIPTIENNMTKIYPNPTTNNVTIENTSCPIKTLSLFDVSGKEVKTVSNINNNQTIISLSDIENGLYIVKIVTEKGIINKKIIKN